jgi:diguanylate cyclase (GGDEF)-like protein/PAS domain S-box-containing protein
VRRLREGIYVTNREGVILDANPAFLEMFGMASLREMRRYSAEELLVFPGQRERELLILERDGAVRDFELQIRRPDGEQRTVLDTAYAVRDEAGELLYHGILIDITRHKDLERKLHEQAIRDPLTGCFNRRHLRALTSDLDIGDATWGAVVIDIDHFKAYNDRYGHQAGDEILVKTSRFLMRVSRAEDVVIRLGGDEFLIFLRDADAEVTDTIGRRLEIEAPRSAPVPFSLGWATREPGEPFERTLGRADRALISVRFETRSFSPPRRGAGSGADD